MSDKLTVPQAYRFLARIKKSQKEKFAEAKPVTPEKGQEASPVKTRRLRRDT